MESAIIDTLFKAFACFSAGESLDEVQATKSTAAQMNGNMHDFFINKQILQNPTYFFSDCEVKKKISPTAVFPNILLNTGKHLLYFLSNTYDFCAAVFVCYRRFSYLCTQMRKGNERTETDKRRKRRQKVLV